MKIQKFAGAYKGKGPKSHKELNENMFRELKIVTSPSSMPTWARNRFPEFTTLRSTLGQPQPATMQISFLDKYLDKIE